MILLNKKYNSQTKIIMKSKITHSILQPNRPVLPEWTRWAWASMTEREYWYPIFKKLSNLRDHIEWLTLIEGVRPAIYQSVDPKHLFEKMNVAMKNGFSVIPIAQIQKNEGYSSGSENFDISSGWNYRVIITKQEHANEIINIPNLADNNAKLGEILGYPKCCQDFFLRTWGSGQVDTTWDQYAETGSADGPVEANMLWRWMGVRWVSHLPCSFQCQATVDIGRQTREIMRKHGLVEEIKAIDTILSWPTKWSGINGIAEIVGPCLKVSTRTDWAPPSDKRWFERKGGYLKPTKNIWEDNKFSSYQGMIDAHAPIISELTTLVPQNGAVIDLGCGNGRLLRTAKLHRPDIKIGGVDINIDAIRSAQSGLVGKWDASKIQDLAWADWFAPENTILVYPPARLVEMSSDDAIKAREVMSKFKTHVVYGYSDTIKRHQLDEWVSLAGYPVDRLLVLCNESQHAVTVGILNLE